METDLKNGLALEWFWAKVDSFSESCWTWKGCRIRGYGSFRIGPGKMARAHRFAWGDIMGPIPLGLHVLHRCDNRACVNPQHLFLGTSKDNSEDMVQKGRSTAGEKNPAHKLTWIDVEEIRRLHSQGLGCRRIARQFSVNKSIVLDILNGKSWKQMQ